MHAPSRFALSTREAFPIERFPAVEHYRRPLGERIYGALLATVIGVCLAAAIVNWWST